MRNNLKLLQLSIMAGMLLALILLAGCSSTQNDTTVENNIKMYTHVWDEVMNKGKLDMINDSNFSTDIVIHSGGSELHGVDDVKKYYGEYLKGFSNIQFIMNDVFGQGDKIVKYWTFKGTHTAECFGIPATGKTVSLDGATIVRMANGKIAEERDFFDNMEFARQLGLMPH